MGSKISDLTLDDISQITSIESLARIIAWEQHEVDYDPCGKSEVGIKRALSRKASVAVKRLVRIMGLDGKGGIR